METKDHLKAKYRSLRKKGPTIQMLTSSLGNRLDRAVEKANDHVLGPMDAPITLVEFGSYACPQCRAANERIAELREEFGNQLRYAFRHRPLTGSDLARRAAELAENAPDEATFWEAHVALMTRSESLTEEDLSAVAEEFGLPAGAASLEGGAARTARARVEADEDSARRSGVLFTPTFFVNGRRYDGPWDSHSLSDAMRGRLGHRVQSAALDFAAWGPSAGILLLLATLVAVAITNTPLGPSFDGFWQTELGLTADGAGFTLSFRDWINEGLLTMFFLVVGLEIKREFTVGHLAGRREAALPVAGAIGGMVLPAAIFLLVIPSGPLTNGWGVPMATDTAFAVALIAMLGPRVPIELRVFLTAAAIVDDIGAILVVALVYSGELYPAYLAGAAGVVVALAVLNHWRVYSLFPYLALGGVLWVCVHAAGLHATLAGVILAVFIPTRPPANLRALAVQADTIIATEAQLCGGVLRHGPSQPTLRALESIYERLESPAGRLLRHAGARSSYIVLPIFALANAGVELVPGIWAGNDGLILAIFAGLIIGKPVGVIGATVLAVRLNIAVKPAAYSWLQLGGAGALAGIGFTMSLFIAGQAFPVPSQFTAAKLAVFGASVLSALVGVGLLCLAARRGAEALDPVP